MIKHLGNIKFNLLLSKNTILLLIDCNWTLHCFHIVFGLEVIYALFQMKSFTEWYIQDSLFLRSPHSSGKLFASLP